MKREISETDQVLKRSDITDITTTYKSCPCDLFAAMGAAAIGTVAAVGGASAAGAGGAGGGLVAGVALGGGAGFMMCKSKCKEDTQVSIKQSSGSITYLGTPTHEDGKTFNANHNSTMR